jgi:hypothetical protein
MVEERDILQHAQGGVAVLMITALCGHDLPLNYLASLRCSAKE